MKKNIILEFNNYTNFIAKDEVFLPKFDYNHHKDIIKKFNSLKSFI